MSDGHRTFAVALSGVVHEQLTEHLLQDPKQEHACLATWVGSTGASRTTYLLDDCIFPEPEEVLLHGNATITGDYVVRGARHASRRGRGLVLLHSHPGGSGWQGMSPEDFKAERDFANLVREITDRPLLGVTQAGDRSLSARVWDQGVGRKVDATPIESVRVVDPTISMTWDPRLRPTPQHQASQVRSVSAWGAVVQSTLARLRILVVGLGSVGLDVATRLAASGASHLSFMDPDIVSDVNRDRMVGTSAEDVLRRRAKAAVAARLARTAATHPAITIREHELSVCSTEGRAIALDHDLIFSCVDRPWPRAVLNQLAYSDLIPVIDAGIAIDTFDTGRMRQATWRAHVLRPGRRCMACTGQLELGLVEADREGLLDDPEYIRQLAPADRPGAPNVALLCASVSAMQLAQFVSYLAKPGGETDGGALRYSLSDHRLDRISAEHGYCYIEHEEQCVGDARTDLT
jgi:hypothetical protein